MPVALSLNDSHHAADVNPVSQCHCKPDQEFRTYKLIVGDPKSQRVYDHYKEQHEKMTHDYVEQMKEKFGCLPSLYETYKPRAEWTVLEILSKMNFFDPSDPDFENNNLYHCYQTAERARKLWPSERWMHFASLIHDIGKILFIWDEPAWAVCGDIFPVGCAFDRQKIVHSETFEKNPDIHHPVYSTPNGIYKPGCGLMNVKLAWGHDEFLYHVLRRAEAEHKIKFDERILYILRYHSLYPWHNARAYTQFEDEKDKEMLPWVQAFQLLDLYSKDDNSLPDIPKLNAEYYEDLIREFCPYKLKL